MNSLDRVRKHCEIIQRVRSVLSAITKKSASTDDAASARSVAEKTTHQKASSIDEG